MTIPAIPDGAALPYYELVEPQLPDRDIQDGGEDLKSAFYTHADGDVQIGTMRRRTHRTSTGEKAPVAEELARVSVAIRLLLELGMKDGSAITDRAKEIASQQWIDSDMVIDGELVDAQRWRQDGWSAVIHLTPTLIIYAILPDDEIAGPIQVAQLKR
jgi:hypothetical protein